MSFSVNVRQQYGKPMKMKKTDYWVVESNPFALVQHKAMLPIGKKDAEVLKQNNPGLNIRRATDEDLEDESIDKIDVNWQSLAEEALSSLRVGDGVDLHG